jgi:lysophospholipase L1-like esterase
MRSILCYGDSNTWGADVSTGGRFPRDVRWPGVLQGLLGADYDVIEEGLGGRTTVWDDPIEEHKNGKTYLLPCLESHAPLDLVIMMLGTNDLKARFGLTAFDIASGAATLVRHVLASTTGPDGRAPLVLLLSPPPIGELRPNLSELLAGAPEKGVRLAGHFRYMAEALGCAFLDTTQFLVPDPLDGVHLTADGQRVLAEQVAPVVRKLLES